jgi:hypothetical protein
VGDRDPDRQGRHHERGVEDEARRAGQAHQPQSVGVVGEHAGRQQRSDQPEHVQAFRGGSPERGSGDRVGQQREDEHAHPAAQLADRLAGPEDGEVVVVAEVPKPVHIRNIYCAMKRAQ